MDDIAQDRFKEDVQQMDGEFTNYRHAMQPLMTPVLLGGHHQIGNVVEHLENYWLFISMTADKKMFNELHQGSMYLVAKCSADISGISACLTNGLPVQAFTLLRSLWETAVTTKYIYQDLDDRMDDFMRYADVVRYKQFRKHPEAVPKDRFERTKKAFNDVEQRFKSRDDWYYPSMRREIAARKLNPQDVKPNMHTMAKLVGLDQEYETMYGTLSKATHGSSVVEHLVRKDGRFQGGLNFDRQRSIHIVGLAIHSGDIVIDTVLSAMGTDEATAHKNYSQWLYYRFLKTYAPINDAT